MATLSISFLWLGQQFNTEGKVLSFSLFPARSFQVRLSKIGFSLAVALTIAQSRLISAKREENRKRKIVGSKEKKKKEMPKLEHKST